MGGPRICQVSAERNAVFISLLEMQLRSREMGQAGGKCGCTAESDSRKRASDPPIGPETPAKAGGRERHALQFDDLPDELVACIMCQPDELRDLCALASASARMWQLSSGEGHWRDLFAESFGECNGLHEDAAKLAGNWRRLYAARFQACKEAHPFQKPSQYEVQAAVNRMVPPVDPAAAAADDGEGFSQTAVIFLVDGSGSVTEADFACMQDFMRTAGEMIAPQTAAPAPAGSGEGAPAAPDGPKLAIIQFSSDVRVELAPTALSSEAFGEVVGSINRMNGGTNIAAALQRAGQLLKPLGSCCRRVLAILTDARVDDYQAREARDMAARLADEQPGVSLHAFGVGSGVCAADMLRLIAADDGEHHAERYLALHVDEAAPW